MENRKNNVAVLVAAIVVVLLAVMVLAYVLTLDKPTQTNGSTSEQPSTSSEPASETEDQAQVTSDQADSQTVITFTDEGFRPTSYTTTKDSTVTVKNESSMELQFSSDDHPAHTEQSELNMSTLRPGQSGTFTVTKTGTFGFHDHINDQFTGTLTVE